MQENSVGNQPGKYQNNQGKAHTANNGETHAPTLDPFLNRVLSAAVFGTVNNKTYPP
jgi:hypothetical protein